MKSERFYLYILLLLSGLELIIPALFYPSMNDIIPIHFNLSGKIDGHGSKDYLWIISFVGVVMNMTIIWASAHPEILNYSVPINNDNRDHNYSLMKKFLFIIGITSSIFFMAVIISLVFLGMGYELRFSGLIIIITLALSMLAPIIYFKKFNFIR